MFVCGLVATGDHNLAHSAAAFEALFHKSRAFDRDHKVEGAPGAASFAVGLARMESAQASGSTFLVVFLCNRCPRCPRCLANTCSTARHQDTRAQCSIFSGLIKSGASLVPCVSQQVRKLLQDAQAHAKLVRELDPGGDRGVAFAGIVELSRLVRHKAIRHKKLCALRIMVIYICLHCAWMSLCVLTVQLFYESYGSSTRGPSEPRFSGF